MEFCLRGDSSLSIKIERIAEVESDAWPLLAKMGLAGKANAYPDQQSGGQQWRVAIARAHALKPEILPLDEVTSALEPELVGEALDTIRHLASDGLTVLIVSHKLGFVREVSSKVTIINGSRPVEEGLPAQIFGAARIERARVAGMILQR